MIHTITIKPAMNGYVVTVGCVTLVFSRTARDHAEMATRLADYLDNPTQTEQDLYKTHDHLYLTVNEDQVEPRPVEP